MGMRAAHGWVGCAFRGNAPTMFAVACLFIASTVGAATIHRSFSSREVGFGGGAGVSVPIDSRVAAALDEGAGFWEGLTLLIKWSDKAVEM